MNRRWSISSEDLPQERAGGKLRQSLPEGMGEGVTTLTLLDQGLACIETDYAPSRDFSIVNRIDDGEQRLVLTLGIAGRSRFVAASGDDVGFREGFATVTAFNSSIGERQYEANTPVTQLRFAMTRQWLNRYFSDAELEPLFAGSGLRVLSFRPYTPEAGLAVRRLVAKRDGAPWSLMSLYGQALTIVAQELQPLIAGHVVSAEAFSARDKDIARQAKEILWQELRQPPSVSELARRVGTNTFKLKQLFHHFFGDTPYGLLLRFRMETAYQILASSHCPVHIAAAEVGYAHASNFSSAFTRYFGTPPAKVARNREPDPDT